MEQEPAPSPGPGHRKPKWRRVFRALGTTPPAPAYGPRKPLREVRKELQALREQNG